MLKKAIYLSGGGARGAYQAGVLKGIQAITKSKKLPADILSSVSAGSINASFITLHAQDFEFAVSKLDELWSTLTCCKIFKTSNLSLIASVVRNLSSMIFHFKVKGGGYLLDTTPLQQLLATHLDFNKINTNIDQGLLSSFEVAANCYDLSENISFFKSKQSVPCWKKTRHHSCSTELSCHHILASSAIPLFFPAIKVNDWHYGDGGVSLSAPLRASVKLGADQILVIGTRKKDDIDTINPPPSTDDISFAKILGNMLNTLFSDNLERDIELINKINDSLQLTPPAKLAKSTWRPIQVLSIHPSVDLAELTLGLEKTLPLLLRYLMGAFGPKEQSRDLLSFFLFESKYCKALVDIGYQDAIAQKDIIKDFFSVC